MKKILLLIILLLPFYVYAEDSCSQDDIQIESITLDSTQGNIEQTTEPNIDNNQINLGLKANVIDDNAIYKVVIKNTSDKDYTFDQSSLSTDYLNYDITYEDNSDIVKAGESKTIYLKVHYATKPTTESLNNGTLVNNPTISFNLSKEVEPEEVKTVIEEVVNAITNPNTNDKVIIYFAILIVSLIVTIILLRKYKKIRTTTMLILTFLITTQIVKAVCTCTLDINTNLEIDAKEAIFLPGREVNIKIKELAGTDFSTATSTHIADNKNIIAFKYSEIEPSSTNKTDEHIISTQESGYPIYIWFDNGTIYWWSEDKTPSLNEDASSMFFNINNLENITGVENFDTSKTTDISAIFDHDKLKTADSISKWNTSNMTDISFLFENNYYLTDISGIQNWDVSKAIEMTGIFNRCYSLEEIDLSNWSTDSVENINSIFSMTPGAEVNMNPSLKRIILSEKFNTSKVKYFSYLLYNVNQLESYEFLRSFDTSSVISTDAMFFNSNIDSLDYIKDWDISNVTSMKQMFVNCKQLKNLNGLENWDVSKVTNMSRTFNGLSNLEDASSINNWNITNVTNFNYMFSNTPIHPEFTKVQGTWNNGTFIPNP